MGVMWRENDDGEGRSVEGERWVSDVMWREER